MINAIIFSYNRPIQLRLLLESIERHAKDIFNINIIYKNSGKEFEQGYNQLKDENILSNIKWIEEIDFKQDVLNTFDKNYDHTCFFTDDDILYFPIKEDVIDLLDDDVFCFSLRLGLNTTYCYTMNTDNKLHGIEKIGEDFIKWNWSKSYMDYGYPLSVDGHIFRTTEIMKMVKKTPFHNPNTLEGNLQMFDNFPKEFMVAYSHSALVNSPTNIVNETHPNRKGDSHAVSVKELNDKYLDGWVIDYSLIDFSDIKGCYQELEFKFK